MSREQKFERHTLSAPLILLFLLLGCTLRFLRWPIYPTLPPNTTLGGKRWPSIHGDLHHHLHCFNPPFSLPCRFSGLAGTSRTHRNLLWRVEYREDSSWSSSPTMGARFHQRQRARHTQGSYARSLVWRRTSKGFDDQLTCRREVSKFGWFLIRLEKVSWSGIWIYYGIRFGSYTGPVAVSPHI